MPRKPAKHPAKPKRGKKLEIEEPGVLYGRYSSHNQKDISVEQQFEKGYELAAEYGIRIIDTYADRAVSGRTDKRRDFQRMMTDAAKGKFRYVIAWKSNRMGRNMLEALINEARLQDLGVRVLYVEEDFDDTAAGRFAARSMMNVNQFYSENMAEDIKRGLYDNAANCMVANGHLPYGYKADETLHYAIDEPKAAVIREIFTRVSCGEAFVDIMASLNARGIKTSYGRPWGRSSFQKILSNERYRGIYIYGDVRKEGGIPRIVSDELYFKVQEVITTKKNPQGRHRVNGDYLLTGKLFCGHCKSPMTGISGTSRSGNLHYYYVCQKRRTEKTCEKKNLRRDDIELQVAKAIKRRTLDDDTINWIADSVVEYSQHQESASGIGLLEDQLKDTQRSIKNLMAAIEQGIITPTTKARLMELEKEQSDIDRKITMAKADVIPVNRDQLVGWLKKLQAGDVHDKKYQAELFDTFLIAVYVYDNPDGQDYMKVVFNYAGSKNTVEIPLDPSVIDNVENIETGAVRLSSAQVLEGGFERLDKLVGQPPHQPDRVDQQDLPPVRQGERARGRVEGCEELVLDEHPRIGQGVQEGRFADVGVADDRNGRDPLLFAAGAQESPPLFQLGKLFLQRGDPPPDVPAVGFELAFARAARADAAAQPGERAPQPRESGQPVAQLRQLDLQFPLGGDGPLGEDVEDEGGAVDDRHAARVLDVAHLRRGELAVEDDEVRAVPLAEFRDLRKPPAADHRGRVEAAPLLEHLGSGLRAGGYGKLLKLVEGHLRVILPRVHRDEHRALLFFHIVFDHPPAPFPLCPGLSAPLRGRQTFFQILCIEPGAFMG